MEFWYEDKKCGIVYREDPFFKCAGGRSTSMFGRRTLSVSLKNLPVHSRRFLVGVTRRKLTTTGKIKDGAEKVSLFFARYPMASGTLTTTLKTITADLFVQHVIEGCEEISWKRTAVFGLFGFFYMGIAQ